MRKPRGQHSMRKVLATLVFIAAMACSAMAWDCPTGQIRQQAPAGTPTSTPYYDVVEGIAFICVPTPTTNPPATAGNTNTNSNASSSTSNSASGASATGGNSTSGASATGGNSTSNSGVNNSGNSSNTNSNTANGGTQKQGQTQGQTQSNTSANQNQSSASGGNNSNNSTEVTNIKTAAASAYAPTSLPSAPCTKSFGAGVSTVPGGLSLGGNKVDAGCDARELARSFSLTGSRLAACKVLISTKRAKQAGVTLNDCMQQPASVTVAAPAVVPTVAAPVPAPAPQVIVVQVPAPPVQAAPVVVEPPVVKVAPKAQSHKKVYTNGKPCVVPNSLYQPSPKQ